MEVNQKLESPTHLFLTFKHKTLASCTVDEKLLFKNLKMTRDRVFGANLINHIFLQQR